MECDKLKRLFAGLVTYNYNLKLLHWNCKGKHFDECHNIVSSYIGQLDEYIDDVAEITKMFGDKPLCLDCVIKTITNDNSHEFLYLECDTEYDSKEVWRKIRLMFDSLVELYHDTIYDEKKILTDDVISKLQEHQYWLRKESFYKIKARLDD